MRVYFLFLSVVVFLTASSQVTILSGFEGGSYFRIAQDIGSIMKKPVKVISSKGSIENLEKLPSCRQNGIDLVFMQFDVLYAGTIGMKDSTAIKNYQVVLPLGKEEIHLITKKSSGIKSLSDLNGKRVGVGQTDQGTYITAIYVKKLVDGKWNDVTISLDNSISAVLDGFVDACFMVGAAPVSKLSTLPANLADSLMLIPLENENLLQLYSKSTIKANTYSFVKSDIYTYALGYALVTNCSGETKEDADRIQYMLESIKLNLDKLKKTGHPVWNLVHFNFNEIPYPLHTAARKVMEIK